MFHPESIYKANNPTNYSGKRKILNNQYQKRKIKDIAVNAANFREAMET